MTYNSSFTGAQVDSVVDAGLPGGSTLYGVSNLLGTVSQADGVPTGAVIESDSSASGRWVRFADGTQICWSPVLVYENFAVNVAQSGGFRSSPLGEWTFPKVFATTDNLVVSGYAANADPGTLILRNGQASEAVNKVNPIFWNPTSITATSVNFRAIAIGRWFV